MYWFIFEVGGSALLIDLQETPAISIFQRTLRHQHQAWLLWVRNKFLWFLYQDCESNSRSSKQVRMTLPSSLWKDSGWPWAVKQLSSWAPFIRVLRVIHNADFVGTNITLSHSQDEEITKIIITIVAMIITTIMMLIILITTIIMVIITMVMPNLTSCSARPLLPATSSSENKNICLFVGTCTRWHLFSRAIDYGRKRRNWRRRRRKRRSLCDARSCCHLSHSRCWRVSSRWPSALLIITLNLYCASKKLSYNFILVATAKAMVDCKKVFISTTKSTIAKVKEVALLGGLITSLLLCRHHCSKQGGVFKIKNKPFSSLPLPP